VQDKLLKYSLNCRNRIIDKGMRKILLAKLGESSQVNDLSMPPNCGGYGRVHHFDRNEGEDWPEDPLPNAPACRALGIPDDNVVRAEVFQCAQCNLSCWYCFVPSELLCSDASRSAWFGADELVEVYLATQDRPYVMDISGGNPGLVPEWSVWVARALQDHGVSEDVYLWVDDNLTTDFYWRFLTNEDREVLRTFRNYGHVACFKGFDQDSFVFNTQSKGDYFDHQFMNMQGLLKLGVDVYGYVTLTCPSVEDIRARVARFIDRLQLLHENLPLRTVPLKIECYGPTKQMMTKERMASIRHQVVAVQAWQEEIRKRFPQNLRDLSIVDVPLS